MKIMVIGCNGQLGTDMMRVFGKAGHCVAGVDIPEIDICDLNSVRGIVNRVKPEVIVNPAAFTSVDDCERMQEKAFRVNAAGPANVAVCAHESNAAMVHISTDYVFNGMKNTPYVESDTPDPKTIYGRSKLEGENNVRRITDRHFIIRIAWLYGARGANFVKAIRDKGKKLEGTGEVLKVVNDQFGTPTWTIDVCNQILRLLTTREYGVYHGTSEGACSWYDFACAIVKAYGITAPVTPCTTAEFPRPAPRPAYSVLENARLKELGINEMPEWTETFKRFVKTEAEF